MIGTPPLDVIAVPLITPIDSMQVCVQNLSMNRNELNQFMCLRRNFEMENWCYSNGEPVQVDIYLDDTTGKAFQVDWRRNKYREANAREAGQYGDWKQLS